MTEPQIVYCPNNHIYDKSIDTECPYCRQIAERQKALKGTQQTVTNKKRGRFGKTQSVVDEDSTELEIPVPEHKQNKSRDDDATELDIPKSVQPDSQETADPDWAFGKPRVMGWLLQISGPGNCGRSVELLEGINLVGLSAGSLWAGLTDRADAQVFARIYRDSDTGIFRIQVMNGELRVNDGPGTEVRVLEPYSKLTLGDTQVVFFPAVGVCGFQWK